MNYMTKYQGTIQFKNHLYITEKRNITEYLKENTSLNNIECPKDNIIRFKGYCNYDGDTIIQQLNALLKSKEITSGTIEFEGESDDYWRLVLKNNEWIEQYGEKTITYKDNDEPIIRNFNDKIHVEYHDCIYIYYPATNNVTELSKFDGLEIPCAIQEIANKIRQICNESKHKLYELVIPQQTKEMTRCTDCAYLYEDEDGKWICDDWQKEIHQIPDKDCALMNNSNSI